MDPIETSQRRPISPALLNRATQRPGEPGAGQSIPSLNALHLSASTLPEGSAKGTLVGTLGGVTDGSTLTLSDNAGGRFQLSDLRIEAGAMATDFESDISHQVTVRETLTNSPNSPRDTVLPITVTNVAEKPQLGALALSTGSVPEGTAATINITGATAGSTLSLAGGTLPAGMTLNSEGRTITGTPSTAQTANFTLREALADSPNSSRETALTVTVAAVDRTAPAITSANPSGSYNEGVAVAGKLTANEPVTWSKTGSDISKVTLNPTTGEWSLESTNFEAKTAYSWTFVATDAAGNASRQNAAIKVLNVAEQPSLAALALSTGTVLEGTAATIAVTGATAGSTLSLASGTLPAGMTLSSAARTITGTPTSPQSATFTLRETLADSPNSPRDTALTVTVSVVDRTAPTITSLNPSGSYKEGAAVAGTLTASEPVTWSKTGADASKVTLNASTGAWSLESTDYETKASYSWTFVATDAAGNAGRQDVAIAIANVAEQPSLAALALSTGTVLEGTAATVNITGATAGSTLALAGGALPAGMALNSDKWTIAGTPTTAQTANFTLRETLADSPNSPRETALTLAVSEKPQVAPSIVITSGAGYAGSVYEAAPTDGSTKGQWLASGTPIQGATGLIWTMTTDHEGAPITFAQGDGRVSNMIEMWTPADLSSEYKTNGGWWDPKIVSSVTVSGDTVAAIADRFGTRPMTNGTATRRPNYSAVDGVMTLRWPDVANDRQIGPATNWQPAYWIVVATYQGGDVGTFTSSDALIGASTKGVNGAPGTGNLQSGWAKTLRVNAAATAALLPSAKAMIEAAGLPEAGPWWLGRQFSGSNRAWKGPIFEAIALGMEPSGDLLARVQGYMAHRNGTAGRLPEGHPYKNSAPLAEGVKLSFVAGAPLPVLTAPSSITNEPDFGAVAVSLPAKVIGERREIVEGDGTLVLDASGSLTRGVKPLTGSSAKVTIRQTSLLLRETRDVTLDLAINPAPFDVERYPEMVVNSYSTRGVPDGPVAQLTAGGFSPQNAAQSDVALRPTKMGDGITFAANSGQNLVFSRIGDALASYRWSLVIFRVDGSSGSGNDAIIVSVNESGLAGGRAPRLRYSKSAGGLVAEWLGLASGGRLYYVVNTNVIADGKTWNVALAYRREGRIFLNVNGVEGTASPVETFAAPPAQYNISSYIGSSGANNPEWALDSLVFGQSELSESMVSKIVSSAMHRIGRASALPAEHSYRAKQPLIEAATDFPRRYYSDDAQWEAWWARNPSTVRFARRGSPMPSDANYTRVFHDDFRVDSVMRSDDSAGVSTAIWFGPTWNSSIGASANLLGPDQKPDLYQHNPVDQTLTLSLAYDNGWKGSAVATVNNAGQGRAWEGGGIFRTRVKFPAITGNPGVGYFPAFLWFYNLEHLFWRTGERIEFDGVELDGLHQSWLNLGSSHVHKGQYPGLFGRLPADAKSKKIYGGTDFPFNVWDGQYHLWEVRIDPDLTYIGVDGIEIARAETPREFLERLYLIADYALKIEDGEPDRLVRHDMIIDYVEVLQRTEQVESLVAPFTARPTLLKAGNTITCSANLPDSVSDRRFYWYSDGYPRGFTVKPSYTAQAGDARIRCMVKAVGHVNSPEAWSDVLAVA
jgi:hypothetical protein